MRLPETPTRATRTSPRTRRATFSGGVPHEELLSVTHAILRPATYLEIGVHKGRTLGLALPGTRAVGVDPVPRLRYPLSRRTSVVHATSDQFFSSLSSEFSDLWPVDLAFVDGMHLFEYALRDFRNVESLTHEGSTIVIDDCLPRGEREAQRSPQTPIWSGDVWKLLMCLKRYRPDLDVALVDASPAGLCIVTNPDASSTVLFDAENEILETVGNLPFPGPASLRKQLPHPYTLKDIETLLNAQNAYAYRLRDRLRLHCRYWRLRYGDMALGARRLHGLGVRTVRRSFGPQRRETARKESS